MKRSGRFVIVGAVAALTVGCFSSGGSDGAAGDGATAGMGASGTNGASGAGGAAGMGAGGTGVVTATGGAAGGSCGLCSVPACRPDETPVQGPGDCCPSCGIVGGGGTGGAGGSGGDDENVPACDCPATPPVAGSACEVCAELPSCTYNDCAGTGRTVATCIMDAWQVETEACAVTDCDGLQCGNQVCLTIQGQAAGDKRCTDDPCAGGPLTCACAASLCTGEFNADACRIVGPNHVSCYATSSGCTPDGICPP